MGRGGVASRQQQQQQRRRGSRARPPLCAGCPRAAAAAACCPPAPAAATAFVRAALPRPLTALPTSVISPALRACPSGIILYAMVYGYYPFNPADPKLPKKMMEGAITYPAGVPVSQDAKDIIQSKRGSEGSGLG